MAHPKRKISKTRRDKRRSHHHLAIPSIGICQTTGAPHLSHHAHWHEGKLYWKGMVVIDNSQESE